MSAAPEAMPDGAGRYSDLIALFEEFLEWQDQVGSTLREETAGRYMDRLPDYGSAAVSARKEELAEFQERLQTMAVATWSLSHQVDAAAVRSRFDQEEFLLYISRPWARDPGFYIDRMLRVAFANPSPGRSDVDRQLAGLRNIPALVGQAMKNLRDVPTELADLAIVKLTAADGVDHGSPYRTKPPAGVLGWYDELLMRTDRHPQLRSAVSAARDSVRRFLRWLTAGRPTMAAEAGVGKDAFNWYLRNCEVIPYSSEDLVTLGRRELQRLGTLYTLERHKNRELPELAPATSAADYRKRLAETDAHIRSFLVEKEFVSIPDYVGELGTTVPWADRPGGRNFWEEIQFRDPHPDHLHAVIPGHRFDALVAANNRHRIRSRITSPSRVEGWATYLEEAALNAGILDSLPRVRELVFIFGMFRAARVPADVWLHSRELSVQEVVDYWRARVPFLDEGAARVDAGMYLRHLPGYGMGYTVGALQLQHLLADRRRRLGNAFVLKDFHDAVLGAGRLPVALIRWEMTGVDDEANRWWRRIPVSMLAERMTSDKPSGHAVQPSQPR